MQFVDERCLHTDIDRHLGWLRTVFPGLGQGSGVDGALIVEIFLDTGNALGVEIDIADNMRRQAPLRIDAAALVDKADTGNAEIINGIALFRRHLPLQPGERLFLRQLLAQFLGVEIGYGGGQKFDRFVNIDDLQGIGIKRGDRHVGGQKHAIAVDDIGPRQALFRNDAALGVIGFGKQRELGELPADRQERHAEKHADQPDAVLPGELAWAIFILHAV